MNRIFKTQWSPERHCFVVTDEHHRSHVRSAKGALTLLAVALLGLSTVSEASYVENGTVASTTTDVASARTSWESAEYQKDWGLTAMNASSAYALGFHGQNTAVGVMDSGALLQKHPELAGQRFHASRAQGTYTSTGNRYQTEVPGITDVFGNGNYKKGEAFDMDGNFIGQRNDSHGTHVTGTVGANRDGSEFHGVAWGADVWVGNTGGTDNTNYGPFQDYGYFYTAWSALAQDLVKANGTKRGGVINNSFGTNLRINTQSVSYATDTTAQTEYEYFLFQKQYAGGKTFVDAAWDAVKDTQVVQVITTGNRNFAMPYHRPLYPYFNPEAESHWIAVAGLAQVDATHYELVDNFNEAGNAKWWTVVAPGKKIYSSTVVDDHYVDVEEGSAIGDPGYAAWGGTSMAAPHVSGAMAVLMSRYPEMSAVQVRDVLLTTASHTNPDGTVFNHWTAEDGVPDVRYGWGVPDLQKGMYGPAQLLGTFAYDLSAGSLDVWTNDISQKALDARKAEDLAWMEHTENGTNLEADPYILTTDNPLPNIADSSIDPDDAAAWRKAYWEKRAQAIQAKLDTNGYNGALIKDGAGTLVLTGDNTYQGDTTVKAGTLLGFSESFGANNVNTGSANGHVIVEGGSFGLLSQYQDTLTQKGELSHRDDATHSVDITVKDQGTLLMTLGQETTAGKLTLAKNAKVTLRLDNPEQLKEAYTTGTLTTTLEASEIQIGDTAPTQPQARVRRALRAATEPTTTETLNTTNDYALFTSEVTRTGSTLTGTLSRDTAHTMASYANNANGVDIANHIEANPNSELFNTLLSANQADMRATFESLGDETLLNASNANVVNTLNLTQTVKNTALGLSGERVSLPSNRAQLWVTGMGHWSTLEQTGDDLDSDFYAGLMGAEIAPTTNTSIGAFIGGGQTENKAHTSKVKSNDLHLGLYGLATVNDTIGFQAGWTYSRLDTDTTRALQINTLHGLSQLDGHTNVHEVYGEISWLGFNQLSFRLEPYAGIAWMHTRSSDLDETVGGISLHTDNATRDLAVSTVGVRGALPWTAGSLPMKVTGNIVWSHFYGDTHPRATFFAGDEKLGTLEARHLTNLFTLGLGVDAQLTPSTSLSINYEGAYGSTVTSNGISATVKYRF